MDFQSFEEFQAQIQNLYQQEEYQEAFNLVNRLVGEYPAQRPLLDYWRITFSTLLGEKEQALDLLKASLAEGFWYSEQLLRDNPSFQVMHGQEEFEQLLDMNRELGEQDQQRSFPLLTLRPQEQCQSETNPCPVFVALHGNASNAQSSVDLWQPAAIAGWLVAIPQSPQAMWKGAYIWDDYKIAESEIKKHLASLRDKYAIDLDRLVLAGHSNGGEVAISLSLSGLVYSHGFIAVDPTGPLLNDPEVWDSLFQNVRFAELCGSIILTPSLPLDRGENMVDFVEMLTSRGIPCQLEVLREVGTDFSAAYAQAISNALDFMPI